MADATLLYYTANRLPNEMAKKLREHLVSIKADMPVVSVSQGKLDFGYNIDVGQIKHCAVSVYRQILIGLESVTTKYVICCEDDMLYHPTHFAKLPKDDVFYYNLNRWHLDPNGMFRWRNRSGMCACICRTRSLKDTLTERFASTGYNANDDVGWGEPGKYEAHFGITPRKREYMASDIPIIHINHEWGINNQRKGIGTDIYCHTLPHWGKGTDVWRNYVG